MIALFDNQIDAIAYSEKIHEYLSDNRPEYNAIKWGDPISPDGVNWWVKQPIEEFIDKWDIPIDTEEEKESADIAIELPDSGTIYIDQLYVYKGELILCRQTHERTIYEPKDTLALFTYYRDNSDLLEWAESESVSVGWVRIYNDVRYVCIQSHVTQSDWTPDIAVTLWEVEELEPVVAEWEQPSGAHDAYNIGDLVLFQGDTYKSLIDANVWSPATYPAGWEKQ